MEIYRVEDRYNTRTGKKEGKQKVWIQTRCDATGQVLEGEGYEGYPSWYAKISLDYGDQDSCMGASGDEFRLHEKYGIDVFQFLNQPYALYSEDGLYHDDVRRTLMTAIREEGSIDGALRKLRIATAKKLIESGELKPEQFTGD